jgi:Ni/Co efflux regulator RcnB
MKQLSPLSAIVLATAVALPAFAFAQDDHRDDRRDDRRVEQRHAERGAGPDHAWHKGDRIPESYRDKRYEVADWRSHHLSAPPAGYRWVQVDGDFVLAAVATGVIADMLLGN